MEPIYEKSVKIYRDDDPPNPRTDYDHAGTMTCWHDRYILGDEQPKEDPNEYLFRLACEVDDELEEMQLRLDEVEAKLGTHWSKEDEEYVVDSHITLWTKAKAMVRDRQAKALEQYVILDLYLYDHSGLTMNTTGFSCPWDSGQVGFIYMSNSTAEKEGIKDIEACLKAEVEEYDQYLRGEVYGYVLKENGEEPDSCWGFYGYTPEQLAEAALKGEV